MIYYMAKESEIAGMGCSVNWRSFFVGVLITRGLLFGV